MDVMLSLLLLLWLIRRRKKNGKRKRLFNTRPVFSQRHTFGEMLLMKQVYLQDEEIFHKSFRMSAKQFDYLLDRISPVICTGREHYCDSIGVRQKLAMTLRYLATGDALQTIAISYSTGISTAWKAVSKVCVAIWDMLGEDFLRPPQHDTWIAIAKDFYNLWNFPNCIGAIDGKHCALQAPDSGSDFYNYKGFHSIVLMAMCDAKYCFTIIDVGAAGRESDGGVFGRSDFGKMFINDELDMPKSASLPGTQIEAPFVCVADAAFPLRVNLLKPYGGKQLSVKQLIFNYRLSRARRIIENTFGLLAARWRILRRTMICKPEKAENYIKALCVLHNFIQAHESKNVPANQRVYCPPAFVDTEIADGSVIPGQWRSEQVTPFMSHPLVMHPSNHYGIPAAQVRDRFCQYFNSDSGSVAWQNKAVLATH